ncbi:hypothetical protein BJX61DRAFT_512763 [Aspergillus egyptiacus]|nr:hypothetical protein BJX61DRAFT_512763 [Aspergillus egyptiacus]
MVEIPDRSASAAEVRSYITEILISRYNADRELAEETACSWQLARGAELHDASLKVFQDVFGAEVGFCLYRSVLDDRDVAFEASLVGKSLFYLHMGSVLWLVWTLARMRLGESETCYLAQIFHGVVSIVYASASPKVHRRMLVGGVLLTCAVSFIWWSTGRKCR